MANFFDHRRFRDQLKGRWLRKTGADAT